MNQHKIRELQKAVKDYQELVERVKRIIASKPRTTTKYGYPVQ